MKKNCALQFLKHFKMLEQLSQLMNMINRCFKRRSSVQFLGTKTAKSFFS
jgi:hypothetical protein